MSEYSHLDEKQAVLALWYAVNTSLVAYYKLVEGFGSAKSALCQSIQAWQTVGVHNAHQKRHTDSADVLAFLAKIGEQVEQGAYQLVFTTDDDYPESLTVIYDPPPGGAGVQYACLPVAGAQPCRRRNRGPTHAEMMHRIMHHLSIQVP